MTPRPTHLSIPAVPRSRQRLSPWRRFGALILPSHPVADEVTLAERVLVLTHTNVGYVTHPLQAHFPASAAPVVVEAGCFVGASSIILPGVRVGASSFVAAGSVVTRDVPPPYTRGRRPRATCPFPLI